MNRFIKKFSFSKIFLALFVVSGLGCIFSDDMPLPKDWVRYPDPTGPDNKAMACAQWSQKFWQVGKGADGKIEIKEQIHEDGVLPFPLKKKEMRYEGMFGETHVLKTSAGWLVGFSAGEWGGGLFLFDEQGHLQRKFSIANENDRYKVENVVGLFQMGRKIVVAVGLTHLGIDSGFICEFEIQESDKGVVTRRYDTEGAVIFAALESEDSLILATKKKILHYDPEGRMEIFLERDYLGLRPNSVVFGKSGQMLLGMRHFVLQLTPALHGYKEKWFIPKSCQKFELRNYNCLCVSNEN